MNLQTFINLFQNNRYNIKYDGSLDIDKTRPFSSALHQAYLESLFELKNQIPLDFNMVNVNYGFISPAGVTIEIEIEEIPQLKDICAEKRWKYELIFSPIDGSLNSERVLTVYPNIGPIVLRVINYSA